MPVITQNKLGPARLLVSPSWCRTKHVENASLAYAFAMDVLDGGCLIEPESPDHATVDVEELRLRANEPTHIVPVIRRSPSGDESLLNNVSSLVASRSMDRCHPILCYLVEEERVGPDRLKLIDFRYHVLDGALLPHGHKDRKHRAEVLIEPYRFPRRLLGMNRAIPKRTFICHEPLAVQGRTASPCHEIAFRQRTSANSRSLSAVTTSPCAARMSR